MNIATRLLLLLVVLAVPTLAHANLNQVEYYYYSDAAHSTQVGYFILWCNNEQFASGYASEYRMVVKQHCSRGTVNRWCEQYVNGSWQIVTCPW